jgi:acyl carrier protein
VDQNDINSLAAYVILANSHTGDEDGFIDSLKKGLREKLPAYMVPTYFIFLDILPLTPNGKIDKKALPDINMSERKQSSYQAPESEMDSHLAKIWSDVLNVEKVGIDDDFFALGGNSLQAAQIIAQIRSHYQIEVPVKSLFTEPTISALSLLITQKISAGQTGQFDQIKRTSRAPDHENDHKSDNELDFNDDDIDDEFDEEFEI